MLPQFSVKVQNQGQFWNLLVLWISKQHLIPDTVHHCIKSRYLLIFLHDRRVYEIIRLHYTSLADKEEYKSYKLDVKKRLNIPYQKEQSQLSKLQKLLKPQEFAAAMVNITNKEQRLEILEKQFGELETHYKTVLEKVAAA